MTAEISLPAKMSSDQSTILKLFKHPFGTSPGRNTIAFTSEVVGTRIDVGQSTPDLGYATSIPRGKPFSSFCRSHRRAAKDLCYVFMRVNSPAELAQLAEGCRSQVNEMLFIYAISFVILRKPALRRMRIPSVVEIFPNKFTQHQMLSQAQTEVNSMRPDKTVPVIINQEVSGTLLKAEHRVSYWREDYGINSHHWHWHLAFPVEMDNNRDRQGELFFYMHQQTLARYDMERLSVGLKRVLPLNNFRAPLEDGYFSKLTINNSGRHWGTRQDNTLLKDVRRVDSGIGYIRLSDLEVWYNRFLDAIHQGFMIDRQGNKLSLSDDVLTNGKRGIDILGNALQADAELSPNFPFYGDFHNLFHNVISFCHDSDFAHMEDMGVMGDTSTSMRDPIFYNLHRMVDELFQEYKMQQRPYPIEELELKGVKVDRIGVRQGDVVNNLQTGWNNREFEAGRGLDFNSDVPVKVKFTHIDHKPFDYHLQITNELSEPKEVTVRIFLAPTHDERGNPMSFMDQRLFWAEMDKFVVTLTPLRNQLVRSSKVSSITGPEELTFRQLEARTEHERGTQESDEFGACGCGWPPHLLVPRGLPQGMDYQLFVMLTDWAKDKVEQPHRNRACNNAVSYCGILDAKFPDGRPMGFPFNRRNPERVFGKTIQTAGDFAGQFDNMLLQNIKITFTDALMQ